MMRTASILFIIACAVFLALGRLQPGLEFPFSVSGLILLVWIPASLARRTVISGMALTVVYLWAAYSLVQLAAPLWTISACACATIAWDLDHFHRYLSSVDRIRSKPAIIRNHTIHLFSVIALSLVIALAASQLDLSLSLLPVAGLVIILLRLKIA